MDKNHLLCFGYGYSAKFLAPYLIEKGWRITGTSRSEVGIADNGVTLVDFSEIDEKFMKNAKPELIDEEKLNKEVLESERNVINETLKELGN